MQVVEMKDKPIVAVFDFDGTITYHDTGLYFLLYVAGIPKALFYFFLKIPTLLAFVFGKVSRQEVKESVFSLFFQGKTLSELKEKGKKFAEDKLPKHLRKNALERIKWHKNRNHRLILVSASLDIYLEPWGKKMEFQEILSSRLHQDTKGKVNGTLDGLNCRNQEKVRRLKNLLGAFENYQLYVYGDSDGDKELLQIADFPFYRRF